MLVIPIMSPFQCNSTPRVLLDDSTAMKHPTRGIEVTMTVASEGAFAMNYDQVSLEANIALRVSSGPSMISFGLAMKFSSPSLQDMGFALPFSFSSIPAPYPSAYPVCLIGPALFPSPVGIGILLSCNPPFLWSPVYGLQEIMRNTKRESRLRRAL